MQKRQSEKIEMQVAVVKVGQWKNLIATLQVNLVLE